MTESELELIKFLCLPQKVVCERLGIKHGALRARIKRLQDKHKVENQRALIVKVLKLGLLALESLEYREFGDGDEKE